MQEIQEATSSEPLALAEEYAMQESWRQDGDKLTFITCLPISSEDIPVGIKKSDVPLESLVGDVNLFLTFDEDTDELVGELELMIARKEFQGQGLGRASLLAFLKFLVKAEADICVEFCRSHRGVALGSKVIKDSLGHLRAKIKKENQRSIRLFQSLGFVQHGEVNYFDEVELQWRMPSEQEIEGWSLRNGLTSWDTLLYVDR